MEPGGEGARDHEAVSAAALLVCSALGAPMGLILSLVNTYGHVQTTCYDVVTTPGHGMLEEQEMCQAVPVAAVKPLSMLRRDELPRHLHRCPWGRG